MLPCKDLNAICFNSKVFTYMWVFLWKKPADKILLRKNIKHISMCAEDVYNIAVIVYYFVSNQPEPEELYNITMIIKS